MTPSTAKLRQTMLGQVMELLDRLPTVTVMADGRADSKALGGGSGSGHSNPTPTISGSQSAARQVLADYVRARDALNKAAWMAKRLVPDVVPCCFGCGEPTNGRATMRFAGDLYHKTPCEMRARRAAAAAAK